MLRGGEHDAGGKQTRGLHQISPARRPAAPIAAGARRLVEPVPVGQATAPHTAGPSVGIDWLSGAGVAVSIHAAAGLTRRPGRTARGGLNGL
jgi:hypothetical protein